MKASHLLIGAGVLLAAAALFKKSPSTSSQAPASEAAPVPSAPAPITVLVQEQSGQLRNTPIASPREGVDFINKTIFQSANRQTTSRKAGGRKGKETVLYKPGRVVPKEQSIAYKMGLIK